MKKKLKNNKMEQLGSWHLLRAFGVVLLLALAGCAGKETAHSHVDTYLCPMHPSVVSDQPGTCPVCGMDLVRKARPGEEVEITDDLAKLIKSPNEIVTASIPSVRAQYKAMPIRIQLLGVVGYDTRSLSVISSRISGRLEKVGLKYNFQPVSKGQKVAEIYSAELVQAQRELIYLLQHDPENTTLIQAATTKLRYLGANDSQIKTCKQKMQPTETFAIESPYAGYLITTTQSTPQAPINAPTSGTGGDMGMSKPPSQNTATANETVPSDLLREGNYVSAGQPLFKIVNPQSIWIEFKVSSDMAVQLQKGQKLTWTSDGEVVESKLDFIEPFSEGGENFTVARSYYRGKNAKIGQLVEASMEVASREALWLPQDAITDLGLTRIVFIKERGQWKPKQITTGLQAEGWVEVISGITSGDELAARAQYLIDSESFIKTSK